MTYRTTIALLAESLKSLDSCASIGYSVSPTTDANQIAIWWLGAWAMEGLIPFQQCSRVAKQYGPPRFDLNRPQYPLSQTYVLKMQCTRAYVCTGPHLCEYVPRVLGDFNVQIIETLKSKNPYLQWKVVRMSERRATKVIPKWKQENGPSLLRM